MTRQSDDGRPIGGTAPSRTDPPDADRIPAAIWRVALVTAIGAVMTGLDTSVVNVGLASVGHALGASLTAAQWINSGYLLALAAALPACGWLSNQIGAGRLWLQSLVAFTVLSALCALAPDISTLIIARVLQGLSGGVLIPAGMAILGQTAGRKRMGRVVTIASVPSILAPAVGPVVGALLISAASWRWLFFINVPVGIAGAVLGMRVVPRGARDRGGRLDAISLALAGLGLPAVSYAITEATAAHSILSPAALVPLVAGLVALALFGRRCLGADKPLMDLRLAQNKIFASAAVEVLFAGAALFGGLIVMPLYFQIGFRQGVVHTQCHLP